MQSNGPTKNCPPSCHKMCDATTTILPVIQDFLFFCDHSSTLTLDDSNFLCLNTDNDIVYDPFADDFGPYNLADVSKFMILLNQTIKSRRGRRVVYSVRSSARDLTNGVFLLGAYMIVELGYSPNDAWNRFSTVEPKLEMYRDAQDCPTNFRLDVIDCWRGLERANHLRWLEEIDMGEYEHYSNPLEGDLHAVIPDKLIAFRAPVQLPDSTKYADVGMMRFFAPAFYIEPFLDMGVTTVIRLDSRPYETTALEAAGIRCMHIELNDGPIPQPAAVAEFLSVVAAADGAVAVHCHEGLGRTGTLVAAHLMATHGFSAREAIGWMALVRPGSVVGPQQQFLCRLGEVLDSGIKTPCAVLEAAMSLLAPAPADDYFMSAGNLSAHCTPTCCGEASESVEAGRCVPEEIPTRSRGRRRHRERHQSLL